jgi:hypothetical protein
MRISKDKTIIRLNIDEAMSADQLSSLISDLAKLRAGMDPPVPLERPSSPNQRVSVQDEPSMFAYALKDGRTRLWLRNFGIGWLVFNFTLQQAITLREFLKSTTPEDAGGAHLFRDKFADGGRSH